MATSGSVDVTSGTVDVTDIGKPTFAASRTPPSEMKMISVRFAILTVVLACVMAVAVATLGLCIQLLHDVDELKRKEVDRRTTGLTAVLSSSAIPPSGFQVFSLFDGEWAPGMQMPEDRSDLQAIYCVGSILILGGLNSSGEVTDSTWLFDPITETYDTSKAPMPTPRYRFGAACLDGRVYVAGGYSSSSAGNAGDCLTTVDVYDMGFNSWAAAAPLNIARGDLALVAAAGALFAIGGYGSDYQALAANEAYDPKSDSWVARAPTPQGTGDISGVEIGGKIFVPGGWNGEFTDGLIAYDPEVDQWERRSSMARARGDKAVVKLSGHMYVIGGEIWSGKTEPCSWNTSQTCNINQKPIHSCELYNERQDVWTSFAPLPTALFRFTAAAANGIIFSFGGQGHGKTAVNSVWMFLHEHRPDVYLHVKKN
eukprot:CAMPEP_0119344614 /NCGR_PEP_ID=MMETSP1333-20130426/107059_1 /TAXON_ID=418940 /ORGANISM="Scyphosphaera apsteinii, Strain RCC1455" /LENGTH=425 /DNA_ID=CAMNT_0007357055 /DNA_START=34 /DNA_END=1311 /DNA_ORIENTATION=-